MEHITHSRIEDIARGMAEDFLNRGIATDSGITISVARYDALIRTAETVEMIIRTYPEIASYDLHRFLDAAFGRPAKTGDDHVSCDSDHGKIRSWS